MSSQQQGPAKRQRRGKSTFVPPTNRSTTAHFGQRITSRGVQSTYAGHIAPPNTACVQNPSPQIQSQAGPAETNLPDIEYVAKSQRGNTTEGKVCSPPWHLIFFAHNLKTQNSYLLEYIHRRNEINTRILNQEAPSIGAMCSNCLQFSANWKCLDCMSGYICRRCCRVIHQRSPFHRVQRWNGKFLVRAQLRDTGLQISLGHGGVPCPNAPNDEADERKKDEEGAAIVDDQIANLAVSLEPEDSTMQGEDPDEADGDWQDSAASTSGIWAQLKHSGDHILIVDVTGLSILPINACACSREIQTTFTDLLDLRLFSSSFTDPRTVFTFNVLRDYRHSNLEMHVSAHQYFQKLRRVTNSAFPHLVPNRYQELRRVSRQWRNLAYRRWHGYGMRATELSSSGDLSATVPDGNQSSTQQSVVLIEPGAGDLALFCAACPQPNINLPSDWLKRYSLWATVFKLEMLHPNIDFSEEIIRELVVDGNFTADHLIQRLALEDVFLMEGQAMMTAREPYASHLLIAKDTTEVSVRHVTAPLFD